MFKKYQIDKYIYSFIGLIILAVGINITYSTNLGAAPIEAFNEGLAKVFEIQSGTMTTITSIILLAFSAIITKSKFNFRGAIGGILLGLLINITKSFIVIDLNLSFIILIILTLIGATLIGIGTVITIQNNKILGYNDAFLVQISHKFFTRKNIGILKISYDLIILVIVLILNFILHSFTVGIGTILLAIAIGSNVKWVMAIEKIIIKEVHILAIKEHQKLSLKNKKYRH